MKAPRCNHSDTPFFQAVQNGRKSASATSAASALSKINSLGPGVSRPLTSAEHQSASAKHRPRPPIVRCTTAEPACDAAQSFVRQHLRRGNDDRADEHRGSRGREAAQ
jgi:hypothetical protein